MIWLVPCGVTKQLSLLIKLEEIAKMLRQEFIQKYIFSFSKKKGIAVEELTTSALILL